MTEQADPRVSRYLHALDREARWLPRQQAAELHEQLASHLADAVPPGTDRQSVSRALAGLGDPARVVQELTGPRRSLVTRVGRVRRRTWIVAAVLTLAVLAGLTTLGMIVVPDRTASSMQCSCGLGVIPSDVAAHERTVTVGDVTAIVFQGRSSDEGIEFDVINRSDVTQTIVGQPSHSGIWGDQPGVYRLQVGTRDEHGFPLVDRRFADAPVDVPPGENRTVRITWRRLSCSGPGVQLSLDFVPLRVRIGPFTRDERVALPQALVFQVPQSPTRPLRSSCAR